MRSKNINKQKYAKSETDYEEYLVTDEVPSYFNIFECGRNILKRIDVTYEQACMATTKEKYHTKMLETLVDYNDCNNSQLSREKPQQAVSKFIEETEEEERDTKHNVNNVTMDSFCCQSLVTTNTQGEIVNVNGNLFGHTGRNDKRI